MQVMFYFESSERKLSDNFVRMTVGYMGYMDSIQFGFPAKRLPPRIRGGSFELVYFLNTGNSLYSVKVCYFLSF